ncbi:hypothetical protein [Leifsonia sp. NPDC058248]|uniref:hypothetical protein n=1 Tax=Leifsonia sp. NPDC058248 TaxID=3346402 RepID=UPI0036DA8E54
MGAALNPINGSIIVTALVGIASDLHATPASASALVAGLYLASAVAQPTMGKHELAEANTKGRSDGNVGRPFVLVVPRLESGP